MDAPQYDQHTDSGRYNDIAVHRSGLKKERPGKKRLSIVAATCAILILWSGIAIVEIAFSNRFLRDACILAASLVIFNFFVLIKGKRDLLAFMHPSAIGINYLFISLLIGAIGFYNGSITIAYMKNDPLFWRNSPIPNLFLTTVISLVILFANYSRRPAYLALADAVPFRTAALYVIFVAFLLLFYATEFIFGEQVIGALFALYLISVIPFRNFSYRLILYVIALAPFTLAMSHSKREAIFFLYPMVVIELLIGSWGKIDLRRVILLTAILGVLLTSILAANVVRANHVFNVQDVSDVVPAMIDYLLWDNFASYFLLNIEATYLYFHLYNAIDFAMRDFVPILMGETYVKQFFIGISRDWLEWKPRSAIDVYTTAFSPEYRSIGGSWVISSLGEAFINFRFFGAFVAAAILIGADAIFRWLVLRAQLRGPIFCVAVIYFCVTVLNYCRGTGLDLLLIQFVVVVFSAAPVGLALWLGSPFTRVAVRQPLGSAGTVKVGVFSLKRNNGRARFLPKGRLPLYAKV